MGIISDFTFQSLCSPEDPDDFRPNSELTIVMDTENSATGTVKNMAVIREHIAPGDKIPLHQHIIEEILMIDKGVLEVTLGEAKHTATAGSIVFIPARVLHGFRNLGTEIARITAVFPSAILDIKYHERNPAPGTEDQAPGPPIAIDIRKYISGNFGEAISEMDPEAYS